MMLPAHDMPTAAARQTHSSGSPPDGKLLGNVAKTDDQHCPAQQRVAQRHAQLPVPDAARTCIDRGRAGGRRCWSTPSRMRWACRAAHLAAMALWERSVASMR